VTRVPPWRSHAIGTREKKWKIVTDRSVLESEGKNVTYASLLEKAQAQDPAAWDRLVTLYTPLVYHWCRSASLRRDDIEDVGQEVFRAVAVSLRDFRHDRQVGSFRGWLRVIVRNKLIDWWRLEGTREQAEGGTSHQRFMQSIPEPDEQQLTQETRLLYENALELLQGEFSRQSWQAFWSVTVEEQSPEDVAPQVGISVGSVYTARSRILQRFRREFAELLPEVADKPQGT